MARKKQVARRKQQAQHTQLTGVAVKKTRIGPGVYLTKVGDSEAALFIDAADLPVPDL